MESSFVEKSLCFFFKSKVLRREWVSQDDPCFAYFCHVVEGEGRKRFEYINEKNNTNKI